MNKTEIEKKWAKFKYLILSKDHKTYLEIRKHLKSKDANMNHLDKLLKQALSLNESKKDIINAYLHIWGHFKKKVNMEEKDEFMRLINLYEDKHVSKDKVLSYLRILQTKYEDTYLDNSLIFKSKDEILDVLNNRK